VVRGCNRRTLRLSRPARCVAADRCCLERGAGVQCLCRSFREPFRAPAGHRRCGDGAQRPGGGVQQPAGLASVRRFTLLYNHSARHFPRQPEAESASGISSMADTEASPCRCHSAPMRMALRSLANWATTTTAIPRMARWAIPRECLGQRRLRRLRHILWLARCRRLCAAAQLLRFDPHRRTCSRLHGFG